MMGLLELAELVRGGPVRSAPAKCLTIGVYLGQRTFIMSFGRNPHVAKAEAAEQKARCARDAVACEQAWREAARQWERAADRETDGKRQQEYTAKATAARASADDPRVDRDDAPESEGAKAKSTSLLN